MSLSSSCAEQLQKEQQTLKKFLTYSLTVSALLHAGIIATSLTGFLDRPPALEDDVIEIIVLEEPEPVVEP